MGTPEKKPTMAEATLANIVSSLRVVALHGVDMVMATAIPSHRSRKRLYIRSMQKTVAHAVEITAARLTEFPLIDLDELLLRNEARQMPVEEPRHMPARVRRRALLNCMTWMWTKEILESAIAMHPDMHLHP